MNEAYFTEEQVYGPREAQFVAIDGHLFAAHDLVDAIHGRDFTPMLHPMEIDLHEMEYGDTDRALRIEQGIKAEKLKQLVQRHLSTVDGKLPNSAALLMALEETDGLRFNTITEMLAHCVDASHENAAAIRTAMQKTNVITKDTLDASGRMDVQAYDPSELQSILGDGSRSGLWAEVPGVIIERALLNQAPIDDDYLTLLGTEGETPESNKGPETENPAWVMILGGGGISGICAVQAWATHDPYMIVISGFTGLVSLGAGIGHLVQQNIPERTAIRMSSIPLLNPVSSMSMQGGEKMRQYRELFEITEERLEEMEKTGLGRLSILVMKEIVREKIGDPNMDHASLHILRQWILFLNDPQHTDMKEAFNIYCKETHARFHTAEDAQHVLHRFTEAMEWRDVCEAVPAQEEPANDRKWLGQLKQRA